MTALRLPFTISNQSLTFYIKGRPFSLTRDHGSYAAVRQHLLAKDAPHDPEWLHSMVDVRAALMRESQGRIVFDDNDIIFRGKPLHNVWVDKILDFRNAGEDFSPIWNALDRLVHNPTPAAVERLPIFLERTKLGFLPDGRFIAFKGVQSDYCSAHRSPDGTRFTHQIGDKPRMAREDVDADPNQTCSRGLHVGAPGYVRQHYTGGQYALVLVAVDPVDVVAVPTDYNGEKMRVCGYEVIDHLEKDYSDELLGTMRNTVTGYTPAEMSDHYDAQNDEIDEQLETDEDDTSEFDRVQPGEVIRFDQHGVIFATVVRRDSDGELIVIDYEGDEIPVDRDDFQGQILAGDVTGAMVAFQGCRVDVAGDPVLHDGSYTVVGANSDDDGTQEDGDSSFFLVRSEFGAEFPVINGCIARVTAPDGGLLWPILPEQAAAPEPEALADEAAATGILPEELLDPAGNATVEPALEAQVGDLVETVEGGWPPAGIYPVVRVDEGMNYRLTLQTEHDGEQGVLNKYVKRIVRDRS